MTNDCLLLLKAHKDLQLNDCIPVLACPRCGRALMRRKPELNALSRYADVYICNECGTEEAMLDISGEPLPLQDWYLTRLMLK